jgi:hypothetical protein
MNFKLTFIGIKKVERIGVSPKKNTTFESLNRKHKKHSITNTI